MASIIAATVDIQKTYDLESRNCQKTPLCLPYDIVLFSFYIKLISDLVKLIVQYQFNLVSIGLKCCKAQLKNFQLDPGP